MKPNIQLTSDASTEGFLSGFVEASVEMPADGMNGECVVHYGGEHSEYEMAVQLANGRRDGEALILNDGLPFIKLEYRNGVMTGIVERMNEYGYIDLRGHLLNGMENGFFEEYNKYKHVIWRGYYKNGKRDNENTCRLVRKGKNNVRSVESGEFYELDENGQVMELCLYENGLKSRVLASFNGSTMTEYNENGKRVYKGEYNGSIKKGFVREGKGREYMNGEKTVTYSGDWSDGKREGFGTEFKGIKAVYIGEWKNGMKDGKGEEIDGDGNVMEGWWVNEEYCNSLIVPSSLTSNPMEIKELRIGDNEYDDTGVTEFRLCGLIRLKRVVIGNECFEKVRLFELDGLTELKSVVIGDESFMISDDERDDGSYRIVNCPELKSIEIGYESFEDYYSFEMEYLPSLQSIEFGKWCFRYAPSFSLTDLPQLRSVKLGDNAFQSCQSVVFENLPKLQSIEIGEYALDGDNSDDRKTIDEKPYNYKNTLTMKNLPSLTSFKGEGNNLGYIGSVILENIPKLSSSGIRFDDSCFYYTYSLQSSSNPSPFSSSFDTDALESYIRRKSFYV